MADDQTPATRGQVEELLRQFRDHDANQLRRFRAVHRRLDAQRKILSDQAACVARIDERTKQHEGRMDRADRRAGLLGGGLGGVVAVIVTAVKAWVIPGGAS